MTIVHIILTRRFAGSERYAVELANMQAAEHSVTLILFANAAEDRVDAIARRVSDKVRIIYVSNLKPLAVWQARHAIRKLKPDVCHAHLSWGCRVLAGLGREAGARIATLHITYKPQQHSQLDGLIAIAPWQLASVPEGMRSRTAQIDNWTMAPGADVGARERLRRQYQIPASALVLGTLGRLDSSKGLDTVIEAFKRAALENAVLVVVGDGKIRPQLEAIANNRVVFVGYSSEPQNWLAVFDVFVSAARSEPFGLVFLEAMRAGLPIIASASEGAQHLAGHIGTPLLAIDDLEGFAMAFQNVGRQPPARRTYNLQQFDAAARAADVMAFYRRILDR